jgi:hypothetical protein
MNPILSAQSVSLPINLFHGRCLCGAVRYQVELDARSDGALWGFSVWECIIAPSNFKLLAGAEELSGHQFAAKSAHHFFCERCGTRSFSHHAESACGEFYTVDLRSLDGRQRHVA